MTPRLVFLGTPEAAVPSLEALVAEHDVALVVTQPDRPRGRSGRDQPTPVKVAAGSLGLPTSQPGDASSLHEAIANVSPFDAGVVVGYGRILRPDLLSLPRLGFLNVHFSLLPRWRGAAPVARALMAGDTMTGVTIIELDEGLDTGPVLTAQAIDIPKEENRGELTQRLAMLGGQLLARSIGGYLTGDVEPVAQSEEGVTYADKLTKEDRRLDLEGTATEFIARVRGLAPDPGATLRVDGEIFKVLKAAPSSHAPEPGRWEQAEGRLVVGLGGGGVELSLVQPPGKRPMSGTDWLRGARVVTGLVE